MLYGGALEFCRVKENGVQGDMDGFQFLQNVSTFNLGSDETSYISSDAVKVCLCTDNGTADCSGSINQAVEIERGRAFNLSVITLGQLNSHVPSRVISYLDNRFSVELQSRSYDDVTRTSACRNLGLRLFTMENYAESTLTL